MQAGGGLFISAVRSLRLQNLIISQNIARVCSLFGISSGLEYSHVHLLPNAVQGAGGVSANKVNSVLVQGSNIDATEKLHCDNCRSLV